MSILMQILMCIFKLIKIHLSVSELYVCDEAEKIKEISVRIVRDLFDKHRGFLLNRYDTR